MPRRGNTSEGKRHVTSVPVKLLKPEASLRKKNADRMYAKSFVDDMFEVAKIFGPHATQFVSNDDKAKVPLGLAANLQAPLLMHLEYEVRLPDHDFVVGSRHKLTPSVYGVCTINSKGKVTYSGDTFIRIRSGKHDNSSVNTHAYDMHNLLSSGKINRKPIMLMETDGAQDEAPCFPKPLASAVSLFKEYNLDVLLHGVNASGLSAFNPVERRMAPLSHDLAGLVLPHDSFGNHLDSSGKTIDNELEQQNFFNAVEVLSNVWSNTVIDGYKVEATAMSIGKEKDLDDVDPTWAKEHVRQSRYCLQVVKCGREECCSKFETNWLQIFPNRFLPFPAVYLYTLNGMKAVDPKDVTSKQEFAPLKERLLWQLKPQSALHYKVIPFDIYCPSMIGKIEQGICKTCGIYWPSKAAMLRHAVCHKNLPQEQIEQRERDESVDDIGEESEDDIREAIEPNERMPVLDNIFELFTSPFTEEV